MSSVIEIKRLYKYYANVKALDAVSLSMAENAITAIVGKSGCGKTTLLNMIGGLDYPSGGDVIVFGKNIAAMKEKQLSAFRSENMGFVFQFFNLMPELTAEENILLPQVLSKKPVDGEYYDKLVKTLDIGDLLKRLPSEMSGGEQQRVAIARSIIKKPRLVLMDEPTGNLDEKNTDIIRELLFKLKTELGMTIVLVTHDRYLAKTSDVIVTMRDGMIESVTP